MSVMSALATDLELEWMFSRSMGRYVHLSGKWCMELSEQGLVHLYHKSGAGMAWVMDARIETALYYVSDWEGSR